VARDDEWWQRQVERRRRLRERIERDFEASEDTNVDSPHAAPSRFRRISTVVITMLTLVLCGELAFTLGRYSGNDIGDAKRLGQATVRSCQRHGPIGLGLGNWDECTATVVWSDGQTETVTVDKPRFFTASEIGSTVTIGDAGRYKTKRLFARAELPPRPLVEALATVLALIACLPLILVGFFYALYLRRALRGKPAQS
jgi:hypothetical protein